MSIPSGEIEAIDRVHMTFSVKETGHPGLIRVFVTSRSRFYKNGEPAITADLAVGDIIKGVVRQDAKGHVDAVRIYDEGQG